MVADEASCPALTDGCVTACNTSYDCCYCGADGTWRTLHLDGPACPDAGVDASDSVDASCSRTGDTRRAIPDESPDAVRGFGMARANHAPASDALLETMGVLACGHQWAGETAARWQDRLDAFADAKDRLAHRRPAP